MKKSVSLSPSPQSSAPPLLDIDSSWDSSAQNSSFVPNPKSSFNPLQPQRAGSEEANTNDGAVLGLQSTGLPDFQSRQSQPNLQSGQPTMTNKSKATVTGSQVEAKPPVEEEPLYTAIVKKKDRSNTRSSLDWAKRSSVSPPPKDWVVINRDEAREVSNRKYSNEITPAPAISNATDKKMSATSDLIFPPPILQPVTSTPIRATTSPSLMSTGSPSHQSLSGSWVDIRSTVEQGRGGSNSPPGPQTPRGDTALVNYRALYSFVAEGDSEISFQEGDILNSIPGELPSNGWLKVEFKGQKGLVPENYLEEVGPERCVFVVGGGDRGSVEREPEAAGQDQEQRKFVTLP